MSEFVLDPRLEDDSVEIGELGLCQVRLMDDSRYPWLVLVPQLPDLVEVYDLPESAQATLWREVTDMGRAITQLYAAEKLNIAALGNVVSQLHVHVIARVSDDDAWPGPVWGYGTARRYPREALINQLEKLRDALPIQRKMMWV